VPLNPIGCFGYPQKPNRYKARAASSASFSWRTPIWVNLAGLTLQHSLPV
jgi:hypothetical protein